MLEIVSLACACLSLYPEIVLLLESNVVGTHALGKKRDFVQKGVNDFGLFPRIPQY